MCYLNVCLFEMVKAGIFVNLINDRIYIELLLRYEFYDSMCKFIFCVFNEFVEVNDLLSFYRVEVVWI